MQWDEGGKNASILLATGGPSGWAAVGWGESKSRESGVRRGGLKMNFFFFFENEIEFHEMKHLVSQIHRCITIALNSPDPLGMLSMCWMKEGRKDEMNGCLGSDAYFA